MGILKQHYFDEINYPLNVDDYDYQYKQYIQQQQEMESKKNDVTDYQSKTEEPATLVKEFKGKNKLPF